MSRSEVTREPPLRLHTMRVDRSTATSREGSREERDRVALGFIPDYYMTEYHPPHSAAVLESIANLEANRGRGAWELTCRAMLLGGCRFGAVDIQNRPLSVEDTPNLVLPSARYMAAAVQEKLCAWLRAGGGLLLFGDVPRFGEPHRELRGLRVFAAWLGLTVPRKGVRSDT